MFARVPQREEFLAASDFDFTSRALEQWPSESVPEVVLKYRRYSTQTTVQQYALQQFKVSITRLLTARRRAGRPEGLPELLADLAEWRSPVPVPAEYFSWFAERAQREGFPLLAVYFARRLLSVRRTPGTMLTAWRLTAAALRSAPSQRVKLLRMFFTGPLRTHGLRRL